MTTKAELSDYRVVEGGGFRSHPRWPWLHVCADGDVWDDSLGRYRKQWTKPNGYRIIKIEGKKRYVHRLVIEAWFGMDAYDDERWLTRHKNGDQSWNLIVNLTPGTAAENMQDAVRHGTHKESRKKLCPASHPLLGENLCKGQLIRGKRMCRACNNARAKISAAKHRGVDISDQFQRIADAYADRFLADTFLPLPLTPVDVLQRRVDAATGVEWCD
ncbi:hypothetical protein ACTXKY_05360 [Corynebacterium variabile]|uniref:hypothetical protein n=1 Tax=Corynebacterium variabile TaxID=1727 RepID=UPI003FD465F3